MAGFATLDVILTLGPRYLQRLGNENVAQGIFNEAIVETMTWILVIWIAGIRSSSIFPRPFTGQVNGSITWVK